MTRRSVVLLSVLALTACTSSTTPTTSTLPPTSTSTPVPDAPSRLAIVDDEGRVVVMDSDGGNLVELASSGETGALYAQPIWSGDGSTISYARAGGEGFAYVLDPIEETGASTEIPLDEFPFYAYWSPDGERIGLLRNGQGVVVLEILDVTAASSEPTDNARSYYFSWEPTGSSLVAHASPGRLVSHDRDGVEQSVGITDDGYQVPQWLDRGVLHIVDGALVLDSEGDRAPLAGVAGPASFVANQQGTKVAIEHLSNDPAISVALEEPPVVAPNRLSVVDLATGEVTVASETPAVVFFWSPDGESLLMQAPNAERTELEVAVWTAGETVEYGSYLPHPAQLRDVFPFFPQYALSMSYWAANSSAFAMVGAVDGEPGVWIQTIGGDNPERVSGGSWAAWSP